MWLVFSDNVRGKTPTKNIVCIRPSPSNIAKGILKPEDVFGLYFTVLRDKYKIKEVTVPNITMN